MLYYSPEVLDADDDVEVLLLNLEAVKLVTLDGDRGVEGFFEYLLEGTISQRLWWLQSMISLPSPRATFSVKKVKLTH